MAKQMEITGNTELIKQLKALLDGGQAHATFDEAVADFPVEFRGTVPDGLPYSAWQLLEHLRITQRDILEFSAPPIPSRQISSSAASGCPQSTATVPRVPSPN